MRLSRYFNVICLLIATVFLSHNSKTQCQKKIAEATCIWRPIANSPDELASKGLAFYKSHFGS